MSDEVLEVEVVDDLPPGVPQPSITPRLEARNLYLSREYTLPQIAHIMGRTMSSIRNWYQRDEWRKQRLKREAEITAHFDAQIEAYFKLKGAVQIKSQFDIADRIHKRLKRKLDGECELTDKELLSISETLKNTAESLLPHFQKLMKSLE